MPICPECDTDLDLDEEELDEGEIVSCPECGSDFEVITKHPLELNPVDDLDEDGRRAGREVAVATVDGCNVVCSYRERAQAHARLKSSDVDDIAPEQRCIVIKRNAAGRHAAARTRQRTRREIEELAKRRGIGGRREVDECRSRG